MATNLETVAANRKTAKFI